MKFHLKVHSIIGGAPGEPGSPGGAISGGDVGFGGGGSSGNNGMQGSFIDFAMALGVPPMGLLNYGMGLLGFDTFGQMAQGDPNPNFGMGVQGPDSGIGVGGGPMNGFQQPAFNQRMPGPPGPSPFMVNPMQVQGDMAPWGNYQQPQMNPMGQSNSQQMYGSQQPFNWGQYWGGK